MRWRAARRTMGIVSIGWKGTDMAHTEGPWRVSQPSGNYIDTPTHSIAALMYGATKADAALIAAAPDLLAALQEAVNKGYMWDNDPELWAKANAAIARAKGD